MSVEVCGDAVAKLEPGTAYGPKELLELSRSQVRDDLVQGLIARESLVLVGGESKQGKSVLCTNLAVQITRGLPWLGREVAQGPVLWVCYEESLDERSFALSAYEGLADEPLFTVWPPDGTYIDDPDEGIPWLRRAIELTGAVLIVIDPLVAACGGMDFDEIKEGRSRLQPLRDLCSETRATALVIHHLNKDTRQGKTNRNRLAGSHQLMAAASADWTMHTDVAPDKSRTIEVSYHARRFGSGTFTVRSTGLASFERVDEEDQFATYHLLVSLLRERIGQTITRAGIEALVGLGRSQAGEYVKQLEEQGILRHNGKRGPGWAYTVLDPVRS